MKDTHQRLVLVTYVCAGALLASALGPACRSPRDVDLDRRIERAAAQREEGAAKPPPAPAAPATPEKPAERRRKKKPTAKTGAAKPEFQPIERYTYSDEEIRRILGAVTGTGPRLVATIETAQGTIECTLDEQDAPQTVANFVALATGKKAWRDPDTAEMVKTPFYDGLTFHRIVASFIIQTGNPAAGLKRGGGPGWTIVREAGKADAYGAGGTLGMVDSDDDAHGSQFFIVLKPAKNLKDRYAPFGRCGNLDVVRKISDVETYPAGANERSPTRPKKPVPIRRITVARST